MRRSATFLWLTVFLFGTAGFAMGQQSCEFNIIGTWRIDKAGAVDSTLYRFAPDGTMVVLSSPASGKGSELVPTASATYELDNAKTPKSITLKVSKGSELFGSYGKNAMPITAYDDTSFTCVMPDLGPSRWVRVDPQRYFIVMAAQTGEFYDSAGPAFPMLIKIAGQESHVDAVGTYSVKGKRAFGSVPPEAYKAFMKEPKGDSEVMLRLEINSAQYERGLKVLRIWERRVREGTLLYPSRSYLNNVLLVKAVAETLNQCSDDIKVYNMSYLHPEDWITEKYRSALVPFNYFKQLRRMNESLHVPDEKFQQVSMSSGTK